MALKHKFPFIFIFIVCAILFLFFKCSRKPSYDVLIEYIKEEKALRGRLGQVRGVEDSVKMLSKEYGVDLTGSYADLVNDPEAWVEILQALKNEK